MYCEKARFDTKQQAKWRLREIRHSNKKSQKRTPKRVYKCPLCQGWHLTALTRAEARQKANEIDKQQQRLYVHALLQTIDMDKKRHA